jgi:hypothetical protein
MEAQILSLLRALAIRPSANIAPCFQYLIATLEGQGYVIHGPSGWMATAEGCEALERERRLVPAHALRN